MKENWLPVADWEGLYEVSNLGRVRSLDRVVPYRGGGVRRCTGRILSPCKVAGYDHVNLSHGNRKKGFYIHQLVARAFIGPCPTGHEVCHGTRGKNVNTPDNLRYGTRKQNLADRDRDGTLLRGDDVPNAKLTSSDVLQIRAWAESMTQTAIAARFGVSPSHVCRIINRTFWNHLPA